MYTIEELIKGAKKLGYRGALVEAALRSSKKKKFTLEQAKAIVKAFAEREVK